MTVRTLPKYPREIASTADPCPHWANNPDQKDCNDCLVCKGTCKLCGGGAGWVTGL